MSDINPFTDRITVDRVCPSCSKKHSVIVLRHKPDMGTPFCDLCIGTGTDDVSAQHRQERIAKLLQASGLDKSKCIWDDDIAKQCGSDKIRSWLSIRPSASVWIRGVTGIGKTHSMIYGAYSLIVNRERKVLFLHAPTWFDRVLTLKRGDNKQISKAIQMEEAARKYPLLILNDLGKENATKAVTCMVWNIIDERESMKRQTWVNSNLSFEELEALYGPNHGTTIVSRLQRMITPSNSLISNPQD